MSKAQWQLEKGSPLTVAGAAPDSTGDRKGQTHRIPSWLLNLSSAPELSALKECALFLSRWSSPVGHFRPIDGIRAMSAHPPPVKLMQRSEVSKRATL
jgi:hypothetical protein